ncbi:hypothetical protein ACRE_091180 [Hapsidospora chrysogenum ATCC 11550]|uniref:Uncharacterized protein n=1 Tax=Hapsidospora chrysogenum (strain ATCC 11550 / CBS 779.69 / DSM 880 / IAM 14645 / JCM 23072 / IMI 49137) TaxID=857340 RepID=A0A086SSZ0_HAPC1|nr:hypothetical protein ACRE_091180 [Hapsidospora chrysogenum ATCC 11550]
MRFTISLIPALLMTVGCATASPAAPTDGELPAEFVEASKQAGADSMVAIVKSMGDLESADDLNCTKELK